MIVAAFQQVFPEVRGAYEKIRFKGLAFESAHLYGEEALNISLCWKMEFTIRSL